MALIVADSMSTYEGASNAIQSANARKRMALNNTNLSSIAGDLSGYMCSCDGTTTPIYYFNSAATNFTCGMRYRATSDFYIVYREMFMFWSETHEVFSVDINALGSIEVRRGSTTLGMAPGVIMSNKTYYIECQFDVSNTADIEVRLNGLTVLTLTGVDTEPDTSQSQPLLMMTYYNTTYFHAISDLYLLDDTGAAPFNTFLGPVHMEVLRPDGDGNRNNWTKSGGTANYEMVDEAEEDEDTTYVSTATAGNDELYTFGALTMNMDTILAVQVRASVRAEDSGHRTVRALARSGTTEATGVSKTMNSDRYRHLTGVFEDNPDTASAWTEAAVNAAEFGLELDV